MSLLTRVRDYAERHQLWSPPTRVVAAVSGGSDSVALLFLIHSLAARGALVLAGLAHLHHGLRGVEADGDASFCAGLASRLGIRVHIGSVDVRAIASRDHQSIEVAGRHARARWLDEVRLAASADVVALAHTRDDQAETLVLRLVRGAGSRGLGGMAPSGGARIRPVLECSRAELRTFLNSIGESWREDASNADLTNPRNYLRHVVLPRLAELNPNLGAALARAADTLRADAVYLDQLTADAAARVLVRSSACVLVRAALTELPEALARRVMRRALETAAPGRSYGLEAADAARQAAARRRPIDLPGIRMEPSGADVVLVRRALPVEDRLGSAARRTNSAAEFRVELTVPGIARDPAGCWAVEAVGPVPPSERGVADAVSVTVDADEVGLPLAVRGRRPGDRLQPIGVNGRKKVQDLFVDRKVPRAERDRIPLVIDARGAIVWVAGHALAEPFRVTPRTRAVVVLTLRRF